MAVKYMSLAPLNKGDQQVQAWEIEDNLVAAGNGDWILVPDDVSNISVTLSFSGATGRVETTTDKIDTVENGTPVAVAWSAGTVGSTTQDAMVPCTAFRVVQVGAGTVKLTARAQ